MPTPHGATNRNQRKLWLERAGTSRNDIVHGGRTDVGREQALEDHQAALDYLNFIDEQRRLTDPRGEGESP